MGFWSSFTEAFHRDGSATKFFEKVPIVGYGVAAVQAIAGNGDHAMRAVAASTNSLITTAGAVGGGLIGGPPGAIAGAAAASQVGMVTEWGIAKTIDNQDVKGDVGEISLQRAVTDAALGVLTGGIGGGAGASAIGKEAGKQALASTGRMLTTIGMKEAGNTLAKNVTGQIARTVTTAAFSTVTQSVGKEINEQFIQPPSKPKVEDPENPGEPKTRIVTENQAAQARVVETRCASIAHDFATTCVEDAIRTLPFYWDTFVRHRDPWAFADGLINGQATIYHEKKTTGASFGGQNLYVRFPGEWVQRHPEVANNPAAVQAQLAALRARIEGPGGLDEQLDILQELMMSETEYL